jgi:pilus assembly protein CpaF
MLRNPQLKHPERVDPAESSSPGDDWAIDPQGALAQLLEQPDLTDLLLVGAGHTFADVGRGLERAVNPFETDELLTAELMRIASHAGARLDIASPLSDFSVGPMRFHAVLPTGVSELPLLSVRRHPIQTVQLSHLLEVEMFDPKLFRFLEQLLTSRANFLISGATGSGKTTLLSALLQRAGGRTICIEQLPELRPPAPGLTLTERASNIEGRGRITVDQLLVHALRMRPDRVVVGEVRGAELRSLLQAMNNGHRGSGATIHAASLSQVADRLILLGMLADTSSELTARLVAGAVDWVIQLERTDRRRVVDVGRPALVGGQLAIRSAMSEIMAAESVEPELAA